MDGDTSKHFSHAALQLDRKEIRLVRLRASEDDAISCKLQHFMLGSNTIPEYQALSYMWGSPELCQSIFINGLVHRIPQDLHDFLTVARGRQYGGWIWIDQICIAQSDTTERNHHVSMMAEIYCGAASGIVWLGQCLSEEGALIHAFLK